MLYSCTSIKQNDLACPDFKSEMQKPSLSFKNQDFFRFLKSDRSKHTHSIKDEFETDKGFKETKMRNVYPTDYLAYKTFEVISEKFILSQHLKKGIQNVTVVNLRLLNKDKVQNKYKLSSYLLEKTCDTIILNSGVKIAAVDILIKNYTIEFKTCTDQNGKGCTIEKELVKKIKYSNKYEQIITFANDEKINDPSFPKKLNIGGFIAFIFALLSSPLSWLFGFINIYLTLILCPLSILLGITSLAEIKKNPNKYFGKGFAIAAIILGLITGGFILLIVLSFGA